MANKPPLIRIVIVIEEGRVHRVLCTPDNVEVQVLDDRFVGEVGAKCVEFDGETYSVSVPVEVWDGCPKTVAEAFRRIETAKQPEAAS